MKRASKHPLAGEFTGLSGAGKSPDTGELAGGLYVTATPIGHARDITLRALDALKGCDLILAEDTRVTARLLAIYAISKPMLAYNDHNAARMRPGILQRLATGARIVLVSDAGTPLVSDPGFKLVREALDRGLPVHALPGASAVLVGLALSGLPSDRFFFAGFLPARAGERASALEELKAMPATLIFFESAQRLGESLAAMAAILGAREAAVARELTKFHEEVRRGVLGELAVRYEKEGPPKGEVTLIVGPPPAHKADFARIDAGLERALEFMPVRASAELVALLLGVPRRPVYERALSMKADKRPKDDG